MDKKANKLSQGKCFIYGNPEYCVLDTHRIKPGSEGGRYSEFNTVIICANHHRMTHNGLLKIDRWYQSTRGPCLHYWLGGIEFWEFQWNKYGK